MIDLLEIQGLFPNILQEGFSAYNASLPVSSNAILSNWSVASPFFGSDHFDDMAGLYTAPVTGVYATQATISCTTGSAIEIQLGAGVNPGFLVKKSDDTELISGKIPVFDTNLLLLKLRTLLSSSTVTLTGIVQLTQGEELGLYYDADGLQLTLTLQKVVWTMYRLL